MPAVPPRPLSQNLSCAESANIRAAFAKSRSIKLSRIPTVVTAPTGSKSRGIASNAARNGAVSPFFLRSIDARCIEKKCALGLTSSALSIACCASAYRRIAISVSAKFEMTEKFLGSR
jgi:hypothetical protein